MAVTPAMAQHRLLVESLDGPVTPKEIAAFKAAVGNFKVSSEVTSNMWVFAPPGKTIEACGLMYEATRDVEILNRMIVLSDVALSMRQDLLPADKGGQRKSWTGQVEPIWPSDKDPKGPAGGAVEQGQVLSHMMYCAKLILATPGLGEKTVPDGDPHRFGATYRERALRYVREGDHVIDAWILPRFVNASKGGRFYFPANSPYKTDQPTPWNQLFMLTNGLVRLAECHDLLKDDPQRVAKYDGLAKANLAWFFENCKPVKTKAGNPGWKWAYALTQGEGVEDTNHAAYDAEGAWIAMNSGRYGYTRADLVPMANTYADNVLGVKQDNGRFAGRVDGTSGDGHRGGDDFVRDEYLYLADVRPDLYERMGKIEVDSGKTVGSIPITARLLWLKARRASTSTHP